MVHSKEESHSEDDTGVPRENREGREHQEQEQRGHEEYENLGVSL